MVQLVEAEVADYSGFSTNQLGAEANYQRVPTLGSSIGTTGSNTSGCLGFLLKLEASGQTMILAVTCGHVLAPGIIALLFLVTEY
jgi:hypothetical protein